MSANDRGVRYRAEPAGGVRTPAPGEVHVWFVDIGEAAASPCPDLLSADEVERAGRFRFERDRTRFVLARTALRCRLGDYLGCSPREIRFGYNLHGKPFLVEPKGGPRLGFNLSHSGGRALLGFTSGAAVGVDLERKVPVPDATDLAAQFFARAEREALASMAPARREHAFLAGWTRKEAMVKALGEGLGFPLDLFQVSLSLDEPARLVALEGADAAGWTLLGFEPEEGYVAAVAVEGPGFGATLFGRATGREAAEAVPAGSRAIAGEAWA